MAAVAQLYIAVNMATVSVYLGTKYRPQVVPQSGGLKVMSPPRLFCSMNEQGWGVDQDLSRAQHWYAEAAAQGMTKPSENPRAGRLAVISLPARPWRGSFDFRLLTLLVDDALMGLLVHVSTKFSCHLVE